MLLDKQNFSSLIVPKELTSSLDISYTASKIIQMLKDTAELYLTIINTLKTKPESAAKLTIKTMLMSLQKKDYATFFKYVDLFFNLLKQVEKIENITKENLDLCNVAFGFLSQIKLLIDAENEEEFSKIAEYGFYTLDGGENMFYLFFNRGTNEPIANYSDVEDKEEFKNTVKNIVAECAKNILENYF
jgi:hypothetical protein